MTAEHESRFAGLKSSISKRKKEVKVVDLYSASTRSVSKVLRYSTHCQGISQFFLHTLYFSRKRNEIYLPLPSQPQLVLIYRSRRDGRLSRPWCEVAPAEIRTSRLQNRHSTTLSLAHPLNHWTTMQSIPDTIFSDIYLYVEQNNSVAYATATLAAVSSKWLYWLNIK